jgi:protein-disulfide isomerase
MGPEPRGIRLKHLFFPLTIALLIGVIAIALGGSAPTDKNHASIPAEPDASARAYALFAGIPQHGAVLGNPKAPVTLQFFGDLQCIDSRRVMLGALPFLIRHWVRDGKLQIHFRSLETDTRTLGGGWYEFREQQTAALAAGRQRKLWNFIDVFYREQGPEGSRYVNEEFLQQIAEEAGLNLERWADAIVPAQNHWVQRSENEKALALAKRLESTPSFLIGRTGGPAQQLRHFSLAESKVFDEAIRELL